jgi:hypothetical protein
MATSSKDIPREALRLRIEAKFGDNGEGSKSAPVSMIARTGQPIEHWYWGRVVHDFAGMKLNKKRIAIDYVHDDAEVLGYINKFETGTGDLVLSGAITPFEDKDRATEVLYKGREGVPYEASIDFCGAGIKIQELAQGEVAEVNGYQFEGPGVIIREWPLRGVAICPHGADENTVTSFTKSDSTNISVTLFSKEHSMSKANPAEANPTPAVEADKDKPVDEAEKNPAVETPATPAEGQQPPQAAPVDAKLSHAFVAAFGDVGARWFLEGKSFQSATTEFVGSLKTKHGQDVAALKAEHAKEVERLTAENTSLKERFAALKLGNDPVQFEAATEPGDKKPRNEPAKDPSKLSSKVGDNIAKVAGAIKLPTTGDPAKQ